MYSIARAVRTDGAGDGAKLSVVVKGRTSQPSVELSRQQTAGPGCYDVTFTPTEPGQHDISVLLGDHPITGTFNYLRQTNRSTDADEIITSLAKVKIGDSCESRQ